MLIKSADDKSKRIALLEDLQRSTRLDGRQRDWLRDELHRLRQGIAGERDAAHYLDSYLKHDPDRALLHDLRFQIDGESIQIDHLVITRGLHVYLLETKNFNGNLHINAFGEFAVEYPGERVYGIPSPLEQSRRHEVPLQRLFTTLGIEGRNGRSPLIHHCVLLRPTSIVHRPPNDVFDTCNVIKADQFRSWHERFVEQQLATVGNFVGAVLNGQSANTVRAFAEKLARQHCPEDPLRMPGFMAPKGETPDSAPARQLLCATCHDRISFAEGKFCWSNERRFGGLQYCRAHQTAFR